MLDCRGFAVIGWLIFLFSIGSAADRLLEREIEDNMAEDYYSGVTYASSKLSGAFTYLMFVHFLD